MKNKAKYIQLNLENCETRVISMEDVLLLQLNNIVSEIAYGDNGAQHIGQYFKTCKDFQLELKKSSNKDGLGERLIRYPDICSIYLLDKDLEEIDEYMVEGLEDDSQCNNLLQNTFSIKDEITNQDKLVIRIRKIYEKL